MQKFVSRLTLAACYLPAVAFPCTVAVIGLRLGKLGVAWKLLQGGPLAAIIFLTGFGFLSWLAFQKSFQADRIKKNYHGLVLFFFFAIGYFLLASLFNSPEFNTNNIFFAADSRSWYLRLSDEAGWQIGTRAVHPLAQLLLRPVIWFISLLTGGNRFHALLILLSAAGGACVFLTWKIMAGLSAETYYPIAIATLLGISFSHLIYASISESYIFSAFGLLLFSWLLLTQKPVFLLILGGIFTLGITVTNFVQEVISALWVTRNMKRVILLVLTVLLVSAGLNLLSRLVYPKTEYFFLPQNLLGEKRFAQAIDLQRIGSLAGNMFLFSVAAPQPYFKAHQGKWPRFNFLGDAASGYTGLGYAVVIIWLALLAWAVFCLIKEWKDRTRASHLALGLLACLGFNAALHLGYGGELFLYSGDWTYALALIVGIGLAGNAGRSWLKAGLFTLVGSLFLNNLWVMYIMAWNLMPFLH